MHERDNPDQGEGKKKRGTALHRSLRITTEGHGRESDRSGEANRRGNKAGHESQRRMVDSREEMILAAGARQGGAQFAITKSAAKREDAADNPQH